MTAPNVPGQGNSPWTTWAQWIHDRAVQVFGSTADAVNGAIVRRGDTDGEISANTFVVIEPPSAGLHATNKDYVDGIGTELSVADTVARRGALGDLRGTGVFSDKPAVEWPDELTRKDYVDSAIAAATAKVAAPTGSASANRTAIQAAVDALGAGGGTVQLSPGNYTISGAPISLPSKVTLVGAGKDATRITQTTASTPAIVSHNWLAASGASPGGNTHVRNLAVFGATGAGAHGIVLRDFYSSIIDVSVYNCGGDGIHATCYNDADAAASGTLVENRFDRIDVHEAKGIGFYNRSSGSSLSDGYLGHINVDGGSPGSGGLAGVRIEGSAGWTIGHIHAYGAFTAEAVRIVGAWNTTWHSAQIEEGWTGYGAILASVQRGIQIGTLNIACNDRAGETALLAEKSGSLNPLDSSSIGALAVIQDYNRATTGLSWDNTDALLRVGSIVRNGAFANQIAPTAGFGASAIRLDVRNDGGASAVRVMTSAAYTALATKDANTLYVIQG